MKKVISAILSILTVLSMFVFNTTASATYYESESNDTRDTANVISLDDEVVGRINSENDVDWYKITIFEAGRFVVSRSSKYYLDMFLYRTLPDGSVSFENSTSGNSICSINSGITTYYLRLSSTYSFEYELIIKLTDTSSDQYEKEKNDSSKVADCIGVFEEVSGIINNEDDVDWYKITLPVSGRFTVTRSSQYYLDMSLYRTLPDGTISFENSTSSNSIYSINSGSNVYYIRLSSGYESFYYTLTVTCDIPTPNTFKATQTTSSVKLNWSRVSGITGYVLYRYNPNTKKYKKVAQLGKSTTSYTVSNLKAGTEYTYAIRSYYKTNGKNYFSAYKHLTTATKPNAPEIRSVATGNRKVALSWSKSAGATYYQVYMATDYYGKYKRISTTDARKLVKKGLSRGQTYYFKVRSYKVFDGGKVYSAFSDIRSANV